MRLVSGAETEGPQVGVSDGTARQNQTSVTKSATALIESGARQGAARQFQGGAGGSPPGGDDDGGDRRSRVRSPKRTKEKDKKSKKEKEKKRGRSHTPRAPRAPGKKAPHPRREREVLGYFETPEGENIPIYRSGGDLPGFHAAQALEDLPGRAFGTFGVSLPRMKSEEVIKAMTAAFEAANVARAKRLEVEKKKKRRQKKKSKGKRKKRSSSSTSSSSSNSRSGSSSSSLPSILGRDEQPFRKAAKNRPGLIFATAIAEARAGVQQLNHELQASRSGPVFESFMKHCFYPKVGGKVSSHRDELEMLTIVLDEVIAGRFVEAADILASRMRYLTVGVDSNNWASARELLVYRPLHNALITDSMLDVAHTAAAKRIKREEKADKVNKRAGR